MVERKKIQKKKFFDDNQDLRPRTHRSEAARGVGQQIAEAVAQKLQLARQLRNQDKGVDADALELRANLVGGVLPVTFGVENPSYDRYEVGGVLYECNPNVRGYVAEFRLPQVEIDDLKNILEVGEELTLSEEKRQLIRANIGLKPAQNLVFHQTRLTASDGIVWVEAITQDSTTSYWRIMVIPLKSEGEINSEK